VTRRPTEDDVDRARIRVLDENLEPRDDREITCGFNPTDVSVDKRVTYAEQELPGLDAPVQQFVSGSAETLSAELFFDTYEDGEDVRTQTDQLTRLLMVDGDRHAPPVVTFAWGRIALTSLLESANTTYTMFAGDGTPVRARMEVTFREYTPPEKQLRGEPRHSADRASVHRVVEGETLPSIATAEYGSPTRWREIAAANDVVNPRRLEPGTVLRVPPLERS
jgi:nucleoid-associated protein YgaU